MGKFIQGKFVPKNKQKYKGDWKTINFRSSWELKAFKWCDSSKNILRWNSEEIIIPYINECDSKPHRYFMDLYIEYKDKYGKLVKMIVEIKPHKQTKPPSKRSKNYLNEVKTYITNQSKWKYARNYAKKRGWKFTIWTEKELGIK